MKINISDSISVIQRKLSAGGQITFEKGVYDLKRTLLLNSKTVIDLNGAVLRRQHSGYVFRAACTPETRKYLGAHDIVIKNGTIEGINSKNYGAAPLTSFMHAKNLTFERITYLDSVGEHAIDLVGCANVVIKDCKFLGFKAREKTFKEAIQIDFAWAKGCSIFDKKAAAYDLTHCKNILIDGCIFGGSATYPANYVAIGTHTMAAAGQHTGITIKNCTAKGNGVDADGRGYFVRAINFAELNLSGNNVANYLYTVYAEEPAKRYNGDGTFSKDKAKAVLSV